jgi:tetratricopeptide (TPR) repeat protein
MSAVACAREQFPQPGTGSASKSFSIEHRVLEFDALMALFGFNKQKVLATAEKYVQQGKLQNAIGEYEKILKNDAKDLTVTNTVGDLYSRLGETERAVDCFKSVGDAYASQGFTVKAIAMYKKICKLKPTLESLLKLAELYSQQGLFNDARAQYLQVAEEFLKSGELENSVRIFQKILEMDPDNSNMRVRLAEVYIRLGKKNEAWQIFTSAAESLRSKGSLSAADEILQRMLKLDPGNTYALHLQGKNLLESGDAAAAVSALQRVPDIDSNPDGLRVLLKAYLQTGQLSDAGAIANKLLSVHNDLTAIFSFLEALMQAGQYENALQVIDQHAERLLAENSSKVVECLHGIISHVRDNPDSLQKLLDLFQKAGDTTHVSEVMELLAHASVQSGDLTRSRDLYQKLAQIEPQNSIHMQNYQQVVGQLSTTTGNKLISPEEAVVLLDDLETTAPAVHQHYSDEVSLAVRSALTDAELFISYNMPVKALGPLVGALPTSPNDLRINQRLALLHARAERFAEAAVCCRTLQRVYSEAEYPEEATRYGELAGRLEERTAAPPPSSTEEEHIFLDAPAPAAPAVPVAQPAKAAVPEFAIEETSEETAVEIAREAPAPGPAPWPQTTAPEFAIVDEAPAPAAEAPAEIDLSSEWDDAVTVEADEPAAVAVPEPAKSAPAAAKAAPATSGKFDETAEEIRFYIAHGMPEQATAALVKLQAVTSSSQQARFAELQAEVEAATREAEAHAASSAEPVVEELTAEDVPSADSVEEMTVEVEEPRPAASVPSAVEELPVIAAATVPPEPAPVPVAQNPAPTAPPKPAPPASKPAAEAEPEPGVLKEFVNDLESSLGDGFLPGSVPPARAKAVPPRPVPAPPPAAAAAGQRPVPGKFAANHESPLGGNFLKKAPATKPQPAPPAAATPLAASAAASAASAAHLAAPVARVIPPAPAPVAPAPVVTAPKPQPPVVAPHPPAAAAKAAPFGEDAGVDLAEMFGELKQDLESDVAAADEDPETHYNLGIAFREMGLLDEAIGELQKACQSFDRGQPFPQIMQTYTWLAQCFLEKGVPEAALRWYERALRVPTIDGETRTALSYELASAYESAGDKPSALKHFMEVYGSNIDYRDVAERIKALKS